VYTYKSGIRHWVRVKVVVSKDSKCKVNLVLKDGATEKQNITIDPSQDGVREDYPVDTILITCASSEPGGQICKGRYTVEFL
jgi:hypothetical protein